MKSQNSILLKPKADNDLTDIYNYSYYKFGHLKAVEYIKAINNAFIKILESPEI